MFVNSTLFNIVIELRKWREQSSKFVSTTIGSALLTLLLMSNVHLTQLIAAKPPSWSAQEDNLVTVGRLNDAKIFTGLSGAEVEALRTIPSVIQAGTIIRKQHEFDHPTISLPALNSIYYDNDFIEVFQSRHLKASTNGIWLTHRAWVSMFGRIPVEQIGGLSHTRLDHTLPIAGILPPSYDFFGEQPVDIYVHQTVFRNFTPFKGDLMIDRFLSAAPVYFAFATVDTSFRGNNVQSLLNQGDFSVSQMSIGNTGGHITTQQGFVLSPSLHTELIIKWRLLLFLLIGFGTVMILNLFSLFSSHATMHQHEFKIRQILGSTPLALLRGQCISATILSISLVLVVATFSFPFFILIGNTVIDSSIGDVTWTFNIETVITVTLLVIGSLYAVALCTSYSRIGNLFSRQMGHSAGHWQKRAINALQLVQYLCSLLTLSLLVLLLLNANQTTIKYMELEQVAVANVRAKGTQNALRNLSSETDNRTIALSIPAFTSPQTTTIEDTRMSDNISVQVFYVSPNYFKVLGANNIEVDWDGGVVINQTMRDMMATNNALIGTELNLGGLFGQFTISGITANLPHLGRYQSPLPAIYIPLSKKSFGRNDNFQILSPLNEQQQAVNWVSSWLSSNTTQFTIEQAEPINNHVALFDKSVTNILFFGLVVVGALCFAIFFNVLHESKTLLSLNRKDFATMLAIGAPLSNIVYTLVKIQWIIISIAFVITLSLFTTQYEQIQGFFHSSLIQVGCSAVLSSLILILITGASVWFPVRKFNRSSIFSKIRT